MDETMMVTLQGRNFMVTACPRGEEVMTMVSMTGDAPGATGGEELPRAMARELEAAARLIAAMRGAILGDGKGD